MSGSRFRPGRLGLALFAAVACQVPAAPPVGAGGDVLRARISDPGCFT